jgi:site-specific DNA-methyltransferase (adenine-specific)
MPNIDLIHGDCMEYMATLPDKAFELAVVDPPYKEFFNTKGSKSNKANKGNYNINSLNNNCPNKIYFNELMRVSQNQIIWGGNYFVSYLIKNTSCWVVWDKNNTGNFADCEIAYTSFDRPIRLFKYTWNGMIQENMKDKELRIHPTQKPVALYKWLLKNYAKQGDRILDTHLGSGSSAIAADIMGFDFVGLEIDKDYYEAALDRFNRHKQQQVMVF